MPKTKEIKSRLPLNELAQGVRDVATKYRNRRFKHVKTGAVYLVVGTPIVNKDGSAWYGVELCECNRQTMNPYTLLKHVYTLDEFTDGRFTPFR